MNTSQNLIWLVCWSYKEKLKCIVTAGSKVVDLELMITFEDQCRVRGEPPAFGRLKPFLCARLC